MLLEPSVPIRLAKWGFWVARAISRWNWKSADTASRPSSTASENVFSASRRATRFCAVRRCEAIAAASVSSPMRNSSTAITSRRVASCCGSMRNADVSPSPTAKVPMP